MLGCAGDVLGLCWGCAGLCWRVLGCTALYWAHPEDRSDDNDADIAGGVVHSAKSPVGSLYESEVVCFARDTL